MNDLKEPKKEGHLEEISYDSEQIIVFKQAGEEYGLHIDQIKEVVITPNITRMPQTPHYIKGVANIRGNIIAIIDLEEKFGLKDDQNTSVKSDEQCYTLVVESEEFKVGILVNEVPNTLTVSTKDIEDSINIASSGEVDQDYIRGIIKLKDRLVILIDIFKVLNEKDKDLIVGKNHVD
ncbi:chemotaxis protein CheW [Fulvivirgaceae bacterium BMA10]|uniref:Chemotaxis protein CheW n=1 Tax=Splendidivirga corallicola TaxID=3051826 RepID=A0ABT8KWJ6_9BACT|nr:chemotaxis protein CheW [Fulvivirgaceae bacterium BMA10]